MKPIGILGGAFDPVHFGHLRLAIECYERLDLNEVRLIPLYSPPHRRQPIASPEQRLAMLRTAAANIAGLTVDDSELTRKEVTYTIDTLTSMRETIPDKPLCLIMGADAFNNLHTWRRWPELLDYAHIVVAHRPGCAINPEDPALKQCLAKHRVSDSARLHRQAASHILELLLPLPNISATQIRACLKENHNPAGLLPDAVIDYIHKNNIYPARTS